MSDFGKIEPRHSREIVVFVVVSDIIAQPVEQAVVRVGLLSAAIKHVVLGYEVCSAGMERACEEGAKDRVGENAYPVMLVHESIKSYLHACVE